MLGQPFHNLNTLLLPDLSNIIQNKYSALITSSSPQPNLSLITKQTSAQILKAIESNYSKQLRLSQDSTLTSSLFQTLVIYTYFHYFIVNKSSLSYLLTFRDEALHKYLIEADLSQLSLDLSTQSLFKACDDLLTSLSICDIKTSHNITLKRICASLNTDTSLSMPNEYIQIYNDIYFQLS